MKIKDLERAIMESYEEDIKRTLRDALISLKIQGMKQVKTSQILDDFAQRGMSISQVELLDLLQGDEMIQDATPEMVIFSNDQPKVATNNTNSQEQDDRTVSSLANKALDKRMKS